MMPSASSWLGRLLRLPLRLVPAHRPRRILSGTLAGERWIPGSAPHGCWIGTYERELRDWMERTIRPGQVVYDVGANVGFFTLLASKLVGASGTVVAIEPLPRNLDLLRTHLLLNDVRNVRVVAAAVADKSGTAFLEDHKSPSQGRLSSDGVPVEIVSLDSLVASGMPAPHVVKMDIEGAETLAIPGAHDTLTRHRPVLFLSTHGYAAHEACCSALERIGYALTLRRDGAADGQYEIVATPA